MCGLGGIILARADNAVAEPTLARMRVALRHRGPDGEGFLLDGSVGLCHTRLAVLDPHPRSRQPMQSSSGRYSIVYNGEIYNFRSLGDDLARCGRRLTTAGDTEVILELVEALGIGALERLEGMFALALFDRKDRQIWLVRDRLGIKPLFWRQDSEGVAFASEPKALPRLGTPPIPDAARVAEYLAFRNLAGHECLLPDVQTLAPGHRLMTNGSTVHLERWWRPRSAAGADASRTSRVLDDAVRRQLVADVPVGVFLSGGVDSALVAKATRDVLPRVDTFTVGFSDPAWDETSRARIVSTRLETVSHEVRLGPEEFVCGLDEAIRHLDGPLNHANSVHLLALSRYARRHITVAMTGEGGDELFAGYPRYRLFLLGRLLCALPDPWLAAVARRVRERRPRWARLLDAAADDPSSAAALNAAFVPVDEAADLAGLADPERALARRREIFAQAGNTEPLAGLLHLERETYLVSLLQRMDRMSMAVGLECRVPLLDEGLVAHALALPIAALIDRACTKKPLRRAAQESFGRNYAHAPKSGFGVPLDAWFREGGALGRLLTKVLAQQRTRERALFDVERALRLHDSHRSGERDASEVLWSLLNLELWARQAFDGEPAPCKELTP